MSDLIVAASDDVDRPVVEQRRPTAVVLASVPATARVADGPGRPEVLTSVGDVEVEDRP